MATRELKTTPPPDSKAVLLFWSSWHEATAPNGSTSKLFETLALSSPEISFYRVEAEAQPALSSSYNVTVVPSFVLLNCGKVFQVIEGADDVAKLTQAVSTLKNSVSLIGSVDTSNKGDDTDDEHEKEDAINKRLKQLVNSAEVVLFMKGSPSAPSCGFSRQAVEILTDSQISFCSFDILTDEDVRQNLKTFSDWPTYPQLYVNGTLIGGLDIMKEMKEEGDLAVQLNVPKIKEMDSVSEPVIIKTLYDRLKELVNRSKVMLFMKGLPSQPRCGFSRQICQILTDQEIDFDAFDILGDEEVRQGLKTYSDWPTYPQLYVDGDLIGGLDIVREMVESDELNDLISS